MSDSSESAAEPTPAAMRPAFGRLQFRLWHALVLLVVVAVALGVYVRMTRVEYRYADLERASRLGNFLGHRLVETLGDQQGPYLHSGGSTLNRGAKKSIFFHVDGQSVTRDLTGLDQEEVQVAFFLNPRGNHGVLIFVREQDNGAIVVGK